MFLAPLDRETERETEREGEREGEIGVTPGFNVGQIGRSGRHIFTRYLSWGKEDEYQVRKRSPL